MDRVTMISPHHALPRARPLRSGCNRTLSLVGSLRLGRWRHPVLTCPYCKQLAMTLLRKCILSPDSVVACASCGRKVGVPWLAIGAAVPVALGIVVAVKLAVPWSIAGAVGGLVAYVGIQRFVVPVVGRDG